VRHLLATAYGVPELAVHRPLDLHWELLPEACIVQMHWLPVSSFLRNLADYDFRIVAMTRHPLDVLLSILHFTLHDATAAWLEGECGTERPVYGAMPRSDAFLNYATGPRAAALLAVSRAWWHREPAVRLQYETLNRDPEGELQRLLNELGGEPARTASEVVAEHTMPQLRSRTNNEHHFWQGRPGLWKQLLTTAEAVRIAAVLEPLYREFDYDWDADSRLSGVQADANWCHLVWADVAQEINDLRLTKHLLKTARDDLNVAHAELVANRDELASLRAENQTLNLTLGTTTVERDALRQRLQPVADLGPRALAVAARIRGASVRYPRLSRLTKWLLSSKSTEQV
jgi:hypothetical protein